MAGRTSLACGASPPKEPTATASTAFGGLETPPASPQSDAGSVSTDAQRLPLSEDREKANGDVDRRAAEVYLSASTPINSQDDASEKDQLITEGTFQLSIFNYLPLQTFDKVGVAHAELWDRPTGSSYILFRSTENSASLLCAEICRGMQLDLNKKTGRSLQFSARNPSGLINQYLIQGYKNDATDIYKATKARADQLKYQSHESTVSGGLSGCSDKDDNAILLGAACKECSVVFSSTRDLKQHVNNVHGTDNRFPIVGGPNTRTTHTSSRALSTSSLTKRNLVPASAVIPTKKS